MMKLQRARRCVPGLMLLLAACIDGTGPRPRPTGIDAPGPTPANAELLWYETQPRVLTQGQTDSIRINVAINGEADAVHIELRAGLFVQLSRAAGGIYSGRFSPTQFLFGYRTGDAHLAVGFIEITNGTRTIEHTIFVNVRDESMPDVVAQQLSPTMQATARVANIRFDSLYLGGQVPPAVLRTFYNSFPDDYHFVVVIEQVQSEHAAFFLGVRNQIRGLGLPLFDNGGPYGSVSKLEAISHFPAATDFDLAETSNLHELGHRWMNHSTLPALLPGKPHWPLSTIAYGVMGWSDPVTREPLIFAFDPVEQSNGTFLLRAIDRPRLFNDLELYLMGLVPPDSVRPHIVFADQNQLSEVRFNGVLRGRVDTVWVADIIARDGARLPAAGFAPRQMRVATIVLSRNGLLSANEMAFFEHMATRGESETQVLVSNGFTRGISSPFLLATGGRATLSAKLRAASD